VLAPNTDCRYCNTLPLMTALLSERGPRALAWLCMFVAARVGAVRLASPQAAVRHIQYMFANKAGISDRMWQFGWLASLADFHDAMAHIPGGIYSTRDFLTDKHSSVIAANWSFYLDTDANHGNPFHPTSNMTFCKDVIDPHTDFRYIFDDGATCVNILPNYSSLTRKGEVKLSTPIPVSRHVLGFAESALRAHGIRKMFGIIHIRRCDRLRSNANCTEPVLIADRVSAYADINTWIVFWYAEPGYPERLKRALEGTAKSFIWEEDLFDTSDNYLAVLAHHELKKRASASIDTHLCSDGKERHESWEVDQQFEDDLMEKSNGRAYCLH